MKVISIKDRQFEFFSGMDPFGMNDRKDVKPSVKLGIAAQGDGGDIPAALLLAVTREHDLIILWLYVSPQYRRHGYGERLLTEAAVYARDTGCKRLGAVFQTQYGRDVICRGEKEFFLAHGFTHYKKDLMITYVSAYLDCTETAAPTFEDEANALYDLFDGSDPGEYESDDEGTDDDGTPYEVGHKDWKYKEVTLRECTLAPMIRRSGSATKAASHKDGSSASDRTRTLSCGDLTIDQFTQAVEMCVKADHPGAMTDLKNTPVDYFDMSLSSCCLDGDRVCGLLLVHSTDDLDMLTVELLYAQGRDYPRYILNLFRQSLSRAVVACSLDATVRIPNEDSTHSSIIRGIFNTD